MLIVPNTQHQRHAARHEMFRGRLVPCHETPERLDHVLREWRRRPVGQRLAPEPCPAEVLQAVHAPRYLDFLARAWSQ